MLKYFTILLISVSFLQCTQAQEGHSSKTAADLSENFQKAYLAAGCFWCVEAIFESVRGVEEVISGYAGGSKANADYKKVSSGSTKHAEAVEIFYDSTVVSYETLLTVFFGSHDPTTLNRQGPDAGEQYRSTIFYQNEAELDMAKQAIEAWNAKDKFDGKITTTLEKLKAFYPAEDYHQNFEKRNPNQSYVKAVSIPRLKAFQKKYPALLKDSEKH